MKKLKLLCVAVTVMALSAMFSSMALAGDVSGYEVEIQGALNSVVGCVFAAIGAVVTWLMRKAYITFEQKTGFEIEDTMRTYVDTAILNGLYYAKQLALEKTANIKNLEVQNEMVAVAANYALDKVPDALAYFGLNSEDKVRELVLARLPQIEGA